MRSHYTAAVTAACLFGLGAVIAVPPGVARAQIGININVGFPPPPLPIYAQPTIPAYGYLWTPGYWAFDEGYGDYYWVPGTWVLPPRLGLLWTPGYWGYVGGRYGFNPGYWAPEVGYYGGIDYGFGYGGAGFEGGRWQGARFFYNRAANNIGARRITTVYTKTVVRRTVTKFSFNGPGGVGVRPTRAQLAVARQAHVAPTAMQLQHRQIARGDPALRAGLNHGRPAIAATARPTVFKGPDVVTKAQVVKPYQRPADAPPVRPAGAVRPARPATPTPATRPAPERPAQVKPAPDQRPNRPERPARPVAERPAKPDRPARPDRPAKPAPDRHPAARPDRPA
ncbi:MAG: hypothetical protein ACR2FH_07035, partial [Caulobacteraceae bacterium]